MSKNNELIESTLPVMLRLLSGVLRGGEFSLGYGTTLFVASPPDTLRLEAGPAAFPDNAIFIPVTTGGGTFEVRVTRRNISEDALNGRITDAAAEIIDIEIADLADPAAAIGYATDSVRTLCGLSLACRRHTECWSDNVLSYDSDALPLTPPTAVPSASASTFTFARKRYGPIAGVAFAGLIIAGTVAEMLVDARALQALTELDNAAERHTRENGSTLQDLVNAIDLMTLWPELLRDIETPGPDDAAGKPAFADASTDPGNYPATDPATIPPFNDTGDTVDGPGSPLHKPGDDAADFPILRVDVSRPPSPSALTVIPEDDETDSVADLALAPKKPARLVKPDIADLTDVNDRKDTGSQTPPRAAPRKLAVVLPEIEKKDAGTQTPPPFAPRRAAKVRPEPEKTDIRPDTPPPVAPRKSMQTTPKVVSEDTVDNGRKLPSLLPKPAPAPAPSADMMSDAQPIAPVEQVAVPDKRWKVLLGPAPMPDTRGFLPQLPQLPQLPLLPLRSLLPLPPRRAAGPVTVAAPRKEVHGRTLVTTLSALPVPPALAEMDQRVASAFAFFRKRVKVNDGTPEIIGSAAHYPDSNRWKALQKNKMKHVELTVNRRTQGRNTGKPHKPDFVMDDHLVNRFALRRPAGTSPASQAPGLTVRRHSVP
jgi:hypothetical protein